MKENKEIVEKIRSICREKETSLTKLEESFGWSNGYIGKWAKEKKNPTIEKLSMIANELGVSVSELTGEESEKNPVSTTTDGWEKEAIQLLSSLSLEARARELAYLREIVGEQDTKTAPHPKDT